MSAHLEANRQRIARVKHERGLAVAIEERDVEDLDLARSPPPFRLPVRALRAVLPFQRFLSFLPFLPVLRGEQRTLTLFNFGEVGVDDAFRIAVRHRAAAVEPDCFIAEALDE